MYVLQALDRDTEEKLESYSTKRLAAYMLFLALISISNIYTLPSDLKVLVGLNALGGLQGNIFPYDPGILSQYQNSWRLQQQQWLLECERRGEKRSKEMS